jgi:hypothetical protein
MGERGLACRNVKGWMEQTDKRACYTRTRHRRQLGQDGRFANKSKPRVGYRCGCSWPFDAVERGNDHRPGQVLRLTMAKHVGAWLDESHPPRELLLRRICQLTAQIMMPITQKSFPAHCL